MWLNPPCLSRYNVPLIVLTGLTLARFHLFSTLLNTANFLLTTFFCNNESSVAWVHEEGSSEMPARAGGSGEFIIAAPLSRAFGNTFILFCRVLGVSGWENNTRPWVYLSSWKPLPENVVCCRVYLKESQKLWFHGWLCDCLWIQHQGTCLMSIISVVSSSVMS